MRFLRPHRTLSALRAVSKSMIHKVQEYLQVYFIDGLEKSFDKPYYKVLQKWSLVPNPGSPQDRMQIRIYVRLSLLFSSALVLTTLSGLVIYFFYVWSGDFAFTYLRGHWRGVFFSILADTTIRWSLVVLLLMVPLFTACISAIAYPWVWAWNRRADRLNREASVPLAVPAALPGVWPPPPTRN